MRFGAAQLRARNRSDPRARLMFRQASDRRSNGCSGLSAHRQGAPESLRDTGAIYNTQTTAIPVTHGYRILQEHINKIDYKIVGIIL